MTLPDPEATLADDGWLRRMARALARDPDLAEDLAQDAWLASLRADDRRRAWLAGVLRRRGARLFRTVARERHKAEDAAEREPRLASPADEAVADLEMRERVLEEARALDEPLRTAVCLRFFSDLPVQEVARRTGVAPSTAGQRIARGLAQIRERLDRAHGGDRRAWALPLLLPVSMTTAAKTVAAASAALVLLALLPRLAAPTVATSTPGAEREAAEVGLASAPGEPAADEPLVAVSAGVPESERTQLEPPVARAAPAGTAAAEALVFGRFSLASGELAAGATWSLTGRAANSERVREHGEPDDWTDLRGTLDAEGRLEVRFDPPQAYQFSLSVRAQDHVAARWRWARVAPREAKDLGVVAMQRAGAIRGRVVDERGAPITGRTVMIYAREAPSDPMFMPLRAMDSMFIPVKADPATGSFEIEGLPAGDIRLSVESGSAKQEVPRISCVAGEVTTVDVELCGLDEADARILVSTSCRPYRTAPRPAPESIWLVDALGNRRHASRERGSLLHRFDGADGGPFRVEIDDPRFDPWSQDGVEPGSTVHARLTGSAAVVLDVRDAEEQPVEHHSVDVELLDVQSTTTVFRAHEAGEPLEGGLLDGLVPGNLRLVVRGEAGVASVDVLALAPRETRSVAVSLGRAERIAGRVVRPDGAPAGSVRVRLVVPAERDDGSFVPVFPRQSSGSASESFRYAYGDTATDASGRFEFPFPEAGRFLVLAGEDGAVTGECPPFVHAPGESREDIEVVLPVGARVRGRIEAPAGVDLTDWRVVPLRRGVPALARLMTETRFVVGGGAFDCGTLHAAPIDLYLLPPGNGLQLDDAGAPPDGWLLETMELVDGEDVEREYPFPGAAPARILFTVDAGAPAPRRVTVQLRRSGDGPACSFASGSSERVGPFWLAPGRYDAFLGGAGWGHAVEEPLGVVVGERRRVRLEVPLTAQELRFVRDGAALAETRLVVRRPDDTRFGFSNRRTDAEGCCTLRLTPGTYEVAVQPQAADDEPRWTRLTWPPHLATPTVELR